MKDLNSADITRGLTRVLARGSHNRVSALEMAFQDWAEWPEERRQAVMKKVAEQTIRQIVPIVLEGIGLHEVADQCKEDGSVATAVEASELAHDAYTSGRPLAAAACVDAAIAAAADSPLNPESAARYASDAIAYAIDAVVDHILDLACEIWIEATWQKG